MDLSFIRDWFQQIWELIISFAYSILLLHISYAFDFLYSTIERLVQPEISSLACDDTIFYEKNSKKDYNIYVITWNVGRKMPPPANRIFNLLNIDEDCRRSQDCLPDLYAIGMQEVGDILSKISIGLGADSVWIQRFVDVLGARNYILVKCKQMQQLILLIFVKRKYLLHLRKIDAEQTRTGLVGILGSKGAVSIRFSLAGCALCLVNSHFTADDDCVQNRIEDFAQVINNHRYKVTTHKDVFKHDIIIWFGDLNFRLTWDNKLTPEDVDQLILANQRDKLWKMDELHHLIEDDKVYSGFIEQKPIFPPTYKFELESPFYNLRRKPAWTDRILYKLRPDPYANVLFSIQQGIYNSYAECDVSDHRPVASEYNIEFVDTLDQDAISAKLNMESTENMNESTYPSYYDPSNRTFVDHSQYIVEFDTIPYWLLDEENIIEYTLPAGFCENPGYDWIALYRSDFDDLSKYVSYQYVTGHPTLDPSSATNIVASSSAGPSRDCSSTVRKRTINLNFSENSVNIVENEKYVLLYFERESGDVMGVAGISNKFVAKVSKNETDKKEM